MQPLKCYRSFKKTIVGSVYFAFPETSNTNCHYGGPGECHGQRCGSDHADLQDPPEASRVLRPWREGYDVVYGVRTERDGETAFKLWTAKLFYRIISRLSDTRIPLDTGDFRPMDRRVVDALFSMPERDRFVRGMVSWLGFSQVGSRTAAQPGSGQHKISPIVDAPPCGGRALPFPSFPSGLPPGRLCRLGPGHSRYPLLPLRAPSWQRNIQRLDYQR